VALARTPDESWRPVRRCATRAFSARRGWMTTPNARCWPAKCDDCGRRDWVGTLPRHGAAGRGRFGGRSYTLAPMICRPWQQPAPVMEVRRFCAAPGASRGCSLRLAWVRWTGIVDAKGAGLLIGCSSFRAQNPAQHAAALALLGQYHRGRCPPVPGVAGGAGGAADQGPSGRTAAAALAGLPPLFLRSYLGLALGWRSCGYRYKVHEYRACVPGAERGSVPAARAPGFGGHWQGTLLRGSICWQDDYRRREPFSICLPPAGVYLPDKGQAASCVACPCRLGGLRLRPR